MRKITGFVLGQRLSIDVILSLYYMFFAYEFCNSTYQGRSGVIVLQMPPHYRCSG